MVPLFGPMMLPTLQIPEIIHREEDYCLQLNKIRFVKRERDCVRVGQVVFATV